MRVDALIPAAGLSRRMGQPKLALPVGDSTVLERTIAAVRAGGVEEILVVLGPSTAFLQPLAQRAGAAVHLMPCDTPDMRATLTAGLQVLQAHRQPQPDDAWLLVPGDHPLLPATVVRALVQAAAERPDRAIVVPVCHGRRGHPALLRWHTVADLTRWPAEQGLNAFLRARAEQTLEIDWP
ncbi:MAG: nucleotidyltransferase family protein, partial [Gemmataceae bacterium]|nr:nucleotidyltransferase family protein [Gemmataceae bacterium]